MGNRNWPGIPPAKTTFDNRISDWRYIMTEEKKEKPHLGFMGVAATMLKPIITKALEAGSYRLTSLLTDIAPMRALLDLVDNFDEGLELLPGAVETAIRQFSSSYFKSDVAADLFRESVGRTMEGIVDALREAANAGHEPDAGKVSEAARKAADKVAALKLLVDESGNCHKADCPHVAGRKLQEVAFLTAAERAMPLSPCCQKVVAKEATVRAQTSRRGRRSPMDVIGGMDQRDQCDFMAWLGTLSEDDRWTAVAALPELDTEGEFVALLTAIRTSPEAALFFLPLLRERAERTVNFKQFLADLREGTTAAAKALRDSLAAVAGLAKEVVTEVKAADKRLDPTVAELRRETEAALDALRKPVPWTFWGLFGL